MFVWGIIVPPAHLLAFHLRILELCVLLGSMKLTLRIFSIFFMLIITKKI